MYMLNINCILLQCESRSTRLEEDDGSLDIIDGYRLFYLFVLKSCRTLSLYASNVNIIIIEN